MTPGYCAWTRSSTVSPARPRSPAKGLRAIGSSLKAPYLNLNEYRHDVGVGWMWLAARDGAFGELTDLTSDRRMKAEDAATVSAGGRPRWGVGLGLLGRHGSPQHHYPDLMLEHGERPPCRGRARAHEQELRRMSRIMLAYASDARVDHVLYLVANRRIARPRQPRPHGGPGSAIACTCSCSRPTGSRVRGSAARGSDRASNHAP